MIALSAVQTTQLAVEFASFATQSTMLTDMARREKAAAAPDMAGFNAAYEAIVDVILLSLYNQAAPTIAP